MTFCITVVYDSQGMQLISTIVSILCFVLRETPENAELVQKILFCQDVSIIELLKNGNIILKLVYHKYTFCDLNRNIYECFTCLDHDCVTCCE